MKEYHEVMNTIKEFTAEDAMVIVGTVIDDAMERPAARDDDRDRAGRRAAAKRERAADSKIVTSEVVERTGTDGAGAATTERSTTIASATSRRSSQARSAYGAPEGRRAGIRSVRHSGVPAQAGATEAASTAARPHGNLLPAITLTTR